MILICLHTKGVDNLIFRGYNCVSFNGFLKLKLFIPSAKNELLHGILLLRNIDHDTLQKRHLKSLITIANLFCVVISFFSNLLWNPFNMTTLLMIYIEDCRSGYRAKEEPSSRDFYFRNYKFNILLDQTPRLFGQVTKKLTIKKFELLLLLPLCLVYTLDLIPIIVPISFILDRLREHALSI